jgi:hypothetical protein
MDFSRFLVGNPIQHGGYINWTYEFPNGHTASVIADPRPANPFRFEVLSSDPADTGQGRVIARLTSEEVEAKLAKLAGLSWNEDAGVAL